MCVLRALDCQNIEQVEGNFRRLKRFKRLSSTIFCRNYITVLKELAMRNRKAVLTISVVCCVFVAGAVGFLGPRLFEAAAPFAARLMKFAVQRPRGVAIVTGALLVATYVAIGIASFSQRETESTPGPSVD